MSPSDGRRWDPHAIASMLAPALGNERARASVASAFAALSVREPTLDDEGARRVLSHLQGAGGLTAIAARRALSTLATNAGAAAAHAEGARSRVGSTPPHPVGAPPRPDTPPRGVTVGAAPASEWARADLVELLAHAVGRDEATTAVNRACAKVGFGAKGTVERGLQVLDTIAEEPGLLGVTARFAKARFALRGK